MYIEILGKVVSESLLSLYPVFVKNINIPLHLQLWSRFITYIIITSFFVDWGFIAKTLFSNNGMLLSIITIIHVYTSYRGFQLLESGIAYSLFYTYPIMILLLAGEPIHILMLLAIVGVVLLSYDDMFSNRLPSRVSFILRNSSVVSPEKLPIPTLVPSSRITTKKVEGFSDDKVEEKSDTPPAIVPYEGYIMIALAAFTEAIIYFIVRSIKTTNNWNHLFLSYFAGTILFTVIGFSEIMKMTVSSNLSMSLGINAVIGLCGYLLRFYAATRLAPTIYAPLSYVGIVMAYVYGFLFNGEHITTQKIIGTICILASIFNTK
jgi:drug/metabolite transporter (DMT)-like permease